MLPVPERIKARLRGKPETVRFIKMCAVGVTSVIWGFAAFNASYALTGRLVLSSTLSYVVPAINGFILNRLWTFHDRRGESVWHQGAKFTLVNIIGYCINIGTYATTLALADAFRHGAYDPETFRSTFSAIIHGHARHYSLLLANGAGIVTTITVTAWSYLANRFWAFRK